MKCHQRLKFTNGMSVATELDLARNSILDCAQP
jgi:hypothetical protein